MLPQDPTGLIPAGAGNIFSGQQQLSFLRAHPRGCGEHYMWPAGATEAQGSSPRVRGTCGEAEKFFQSIGLIPAGAGNIADDTQHQSPHWAHPRGCGEHLSDMGFYPHTSSFSISLKPIIYFQEYTICSPAS